jgi:hypothetical protein
MPALKRGWTDGDIAKLKRLAGQMPAKDIAAELGRSYGATVVVASKLKLSLRYTKRGQSLGRGQDPAAPINP